MRVHVQSAGRKLIPILELIPSHTDFAQVQNAETGEFVEQLFTLEHQTIDVTGGETEHLKNARFSEFVLMGVMHIFTGIDHMSFLLGLVMISRRVRDLMLVVTGFTIGHSLTLALAVTGVLRPHGEYIDALVALTIALIGAENVVALNKRPTAVSLIAGGSLAIMMLLRWAGWGELPVLLLLGAGLFCANYLMISGNMRDAGRLRLPDHPRFRVDPRFRLCGRPARAATTAAAARRIAGWLQFGSRGGTAHARARRDDSGGPVAANAIGSSTSARRQCGLRRFDVFGSFLVCHSKLQVLRQ
jgi:hypothetical protein